MNNLFLQPNKRVNFRFKRSLASLKLLNHEAVSLIINFNVGYSNHELTIGEGVSVDGFLWTSQLPSVNLRSFGCSDDDEVSSLPVISEMSTSVLNSVMFSGWSSADDVTSLKHKMS